MKGKRTEGCPLCREELPTVCCATDKTYHVVEGVNGDEVVMCEDAKVTDS